MSLDISLCVMVEKQEEVFEANITHNLNAMAEEAGIHEAIWRPEEIGIAKAKDLVPILEAGISLMEKDPERFKKLNPKNGWGSYDSFLMVAKNYLEACRIHPEARIAAYR